MRGYYVFYFNVKMNRKFLLNLFIKKFYILEMDSYIMLKVFVVGLRIINKKGIFVCLKEVCEKGYLK